MYNYTSILIDYLDCGHFTGRGQFVSIVVLNKFYDVA